MYARVITAYAERGRMDEAVSVYEDSVIPEARLIPGFRGAYLLVNPKTEEAISIVLWDTEQDMASVESSGYLRDQIAKFGAIFTGPPLVEHYEVKVAV